MSLLDVYLYLYIHKLHLLILFTDGSYLFLIAIETHRVDVTW